MARKKAGAVAVTVPPQTGRWDSTSSDPGRNPHLWKQVDVEDVTGYPPPRLAPTMHPHFDYLERVTLLRAAATWARVPVESAVDIMERLRVALQDAHERLAGKDREVLQAEEGRDAALSRAGEAEEQLKEIYSAFDCDTLKDLEEEVAGRVAAAKENMVAAAKEEIKAERHDELEILRARIKGQDDAVIRLSNKLNEANVALVTAEKALAIAHHNAQKAVAADDDVVIREKLTRKIEGLEKALEAAEKARDKSAADAAHNAGIVTAQIQTADGDCVIREKLTRKIEGLEKALAAAEEARNTARAAQVEACREAAQMREKWKGEDIDAVLGLRERVEELDFVAHAQQKRLAELAAVEPLATAFAYLASRHGAGVLAFSSDDDGSIRKALDLLGVK